jgi:hypothetical protein
VTDNPRTTELQAVRDDLARTKDVLGTLIAWMAQSANSPIRRDEAETLIRRLVNP